MGYLGWSVELIGLAMGLGEGVVWREREREGELDVMFE